MCGAATMPARLRSRISSGGIWPNDKQSVSFDLPGFDLNQVRSRKRRDMTARPDSLHVLHAIAARGCYQPINAFGQMNPNTPATAQHAPQSIINASVRVGDGYLRGFKSSLLEASLCNPVRRRASATKSAPRQRAMKLP